MLPLAYISHRTPRRLRIKMYSRKGDAGYFDEVKKKFSGVNGIESVEVNALTGSILIIHNNLAPDIIGQFAQANDIFSLALSDSSPSGLQQRVSATFKNLNKQLKTTTQGELDIGEAACLTSLDNDGYTSFSHKYPQRRSGIAPSGSVGIMSFPCRRMV